jgi:hypothetical protein
MPVAPPPRRFPNVAVLVQLNFGGLRAGKSRLPQANAYIGGNPKKLTMFFVWYGLLFCESLARVTPPARDLERLRAGD